MGEPGGADGSDAEGAGEAQADMLGGDVGGLPLHLEDFSEGHLRYFLVELVGTMLFVLLNGLLRWTVHYQNTFVYALMNPGMGPTMALECERAGNVSRCSGVIANPVAGSVLPRNWILDCLLTGLSFVVCSMAAPGATILSQLTFLLCLAGVKRWRTLGMSFLGQLVGINAANLILYFLLIGTVSWNQELLMMTEDAVYELSERLYGLNYPKADVSNGYAFVYSTISGIMLAFLMTPVIYRCHGLHPLAQEIAKGVVICIFEGGFGANGLGSMPNSSQWLCSAAFLGAQGLPTWSKHNYYALKVPFFAPALGLAVGSILCRAYFSTLHSGRFSFTHVKADD